MLKSALTLSCVALIAAMMAACAPSIVTTDGCTIFRPIYGSKNDTPKTRDQVDQHNARGIGACGWKP